jgi:hypothetical protein
MSVTLSVLDPSTQLGVGGEGAVHLFGDGVIKVYHHPTPQQERKLQAMLARPVADPSVLFVRDLVYDGHRAFRGYFMKRADPTSASLGMLTDEKFRAMMQITTRQVAQLFQHGGQTVKAIHAQGYVIGDFNDRNERFSGTSMTFLDTDAWQFDVYPCPVATEAFLAPELYGKDLTSGLLFTPLYDWYSFAVLLFRSLLMVHPYDGYHPDYNSLIDQAYHRVTALDPDVAYPLQGLPPDLLTDDLKQAFWRIFKQGKYGPEILDALPAYEQALTDCGSCGATYPQSMRSCPVCSAASRAPVIAPTFGVIKRVLFKTSGPIWWSKRLGDSVVAVAQEKGKSVFYRYSGGLQKEDLGKFVPGTRYEFTDHVQVTNEVNRSVLYLSGGPVPTTITTNFPISTYRANFRANQRYVFRVINGQLMYGEHRNGQYLERALRPVMNQHTWFQVRQDEKDAPTVAGYQQVGREQKWWLSFEGKHYDNLPLTPLELNQPGGDEILRDRFVRFDNHTCLILRATEQRGKKYLHVAVADSTGKVTNRPRIESKIPLPHGTEYVNGRLLKATDDGIVQEHMLTGQTKVFSETKGLVISGDTLYVVSDGLIVVKSREVLHLRIGN